MSQNPISTSSTPIVSAMPGVAISTNVADSDTSEVRQELIEAIKSSNEILATASTIFNLFPDTITIDRTKVTVTKRTFFSTADVASIRVEDVLSVEATVGLIFGTLHIFNRVANIDPMTMMMLSRNDALRLKRLLNGYTIAVQREIDCSCLNKEELVTMLDKLGEDNHPNSIAKLGPNV